MLDLRVVKRTGEVVEFDPNRILKAVRKAVLASGQTLPEGTVATLADSVQKEIEGRFF